MKALSENRRTDVPACGDDKVTQSAFGKRRRGRRAKRNLCLKRFVKKNLNFMCLQLYTIRTKTEMRLN